MKDFFVEIIDDAAYEEDEEFYLDLSLPRPWACFLKGDSPQVGAEVNQATGPIAWDPWFSPVPRLQIRGASSRAIGVLGSATERRTALEAKET